MQIPILVIWGCIFGKCPIILKPVDLNVQAGAGGEIVIPYIFLKSKMGIVIERRQTIV